MKTATVIKKIYSKKLSVPAKHYQIPRQIETTNFANSTNKNSDRNYSNKQQKNKTNRYMPEFQKLPI